MKKMLLIIIIVLLCFCSGCSNEPAKKQESITPPISSEFNKTSLPLNSYIKTAIQMNYRHIGWDSYTKDKKIIDFVTDAMISALPEELDQTASEINNESILRNYWEQGSCIELVFNKSVTLNYTLPGDIERSYQCDRMLVCFNKDEDVLFLSKDGVYTHTLGPLDSMAFAPVFDWLCDGMELVNYMAPDRAEILGQKITVHSNADLQQLPSGYDMRLIESAMSRSLAFYQAAHSRWYDLVARLATDEIKAEIQKWNNNIPSKANDLMQLSKITDVAFPISIKELVFTAADPAESGRLLLSLGLDGKTTALIETIKSRDGSILVDGFRIVESNNDHTNAGYSNEAPDQIESILPLAGSEPGKPVNDMETLRKEYFEFAIENRLDYVPLFEEGETPTQSEKYLNYAFIIDLDNLMSACAN